MRSKQGSSLKIKFKTPQKLCSQGITDDDNQDDDDGTKNNMSPPGRGGGEVRHN